MIKQIFILLFLSQSLFAIDGGVPVKKGDYPAVIKLNNFQNGGLAHCTGSLISPTIIITAAHCVEKAYFKEQRISAAGDAKGEIGALFKKSFKVKNIFYLDDAKLIKSEIEMISSYVNGPQFHLASFHHQIEVKENLRKLKEKSINIDLAFIELKEPQKIVEENLFKISCDYLPRESEILMLGYGKNQKNFNSPNKNPNYYLQEGSNFYSSGNYVFDPILGNLINNGDSGGPLLLKSTPKIIYGVASYKTLDENQNSLSGTYSSTSSKWAKELYSDIIRDPKASDELKDMLSDCLYY